MKKKLIGLVLTAVFAFTSLTGCGQAEEQRTSAAAAAPEESAETSSSVKEQEGITITDQAGRTVKLDGPAEKLVSSYYISTALLVALGCEDNLAGIEMKADTRELYRLAAPGLLDLPAVGSGKGINVEETAALEPDVVILPKRLEESVSSFDALGIPAVVVNPETQEDFEECLSLLAEITGRQKEGEELLDYYHGKMNFARELTKDAERPLVYLASGSDYLRTCTSEMYQNELIAMAGGKNVSQELTDSYWTAVSAEQLLAWNPDYIFAVSYAEYTLEEIEENAALKQTAAVQKGNVLTFPSEIEAWDYPTPSSVLGVLWLTSRLHPELYSEEAYLKDAEDFYSRFFGITVTKEALGVS
ncbi:ABC transporter substrate-binding protein [Cuneatibacter caecimuris]|uniref:Iron complex transport system substrate-binding protein n=1 Tax=Cuneatibacter caecimuris TaxID=1796618 RepID=A0A4Q7PK71_9FIRM|nr:ABC transporter substrate-binding protein [Cuneatibacter caecimuris]RZT01121.1 iron complex transport system substrate-binding protein [Cuneatibacter caecimuris]